MFIIYCFYTLTSPYVGKYFSGSCGILAEAMLSFFIALTVTVNANISLNVKAKLESNMKIIGRAICVVGGAALLGRSW
jgi:hypothetical protein